jgi:hypothetical protein
MLLQAINSLRPGAEWSLNGSNYDDIVWHDNVQTKPSKSEIEAEITRLENEYTNKEYQRNREKEYPSIQDQLDMQYWDKINGTNNWQQAIQSVKNKYPKV